MHTRAFQTTVLALLTIFISVNILRDAWGTALMAVPVLFLILHFSGLQAAKSAGERRHANEIAEVHLRTIEALALAIDAKDNTTHRHLERVVVYAEAIGRELGLPTAGLKALQTAALLHDIGKLAVPEYIISKPGRLTAEEFEKMKIHTVVGAEILKRVDFPYPVAPVVRAHHERWNGTGYPDGLKGEQIPIGARILAVVDSFDALTSDRQYRRALSRENALKDIQMQSGILYDPRIVKALEAVLPRLEVVIHDAPPSHLQLATTVRIEKGDGPSAGLCVESAPDPSSALYSIAQARQELLILYELIQILGNSLSVDETLQLLAAELQKLVSFDAVAIYLKHDGKLVPRFVSGINAALLAGMEIRLGEGLSGWVAANGKYSLNGNPAVEPGYLQDPGQFSQLHSALSVPLESNKGVVGVLTLYSVRQSAFTVDHLRILKAIGMKAGMTIQNALTHEEIWKSADNDGLTGLPNARALARRLEEEANRARRQGTPYSISVLDVDGLKQINDRFGHLAGNKAIQAVAEALRGCLRNYDFVGRMGGDEFVLILPGSGAQHVAAKRAEIAAAVRAMNREGSGVRLSVSMGAASYPEDALELEQLMLIADRRMYEQKRSHRNSRPAPDLVAANS